MIDFEHVTKVYETQNDENVALEDINIHIDEGEFVFILGHSGAGKSTFLKLIQMEEKPTEGKIYINDQDLTTIKRRKVPYLRRQMGAVFQDFRLIPTMTVYENVAFAMRVTNINNKTIKNRVPFALSLVGLEDKMDRLPDELSGGEQQRVAVARALAHGPKLIIADEPTGNCSRPSIKCISPLWLLPMSMSWCTSWPPSITTESSRWPTGMWHLIPPTPKWRRSTKNGLLPARTMMNTSMRIKEG